MGALRFLVAALLLTVLLPITGHAQLPAPDADAEEIGIDAEQISYDQKNNTVVARGKVVITRGDTELRADEVRLNRATNEAEARGNVRVKNSEGTITADALSLNLDEETGALTRAEVESRRMRYSLRGERVEKGLGQSYHIENGQFTTCHCADGPPSWSISGGDLQVDVGGYGILHDGTFNVLGIPILYIPRALIPIQRERQSGFLIPRFGASKLRGFQTLLPFYWAIDKSQDATLAFDLETSARVGLIGDYRYALSRETHGVVSASYFNQKLGGTTTGTPFEPIIPENRWSVIGEHDQPFVGSSMAYADVFLVGDPLFLRDINTYAFEHSRDVAIRTLPFTESHAGVLQLWNRLALRGEGTYYQNLEGESSQTLQRGPEVDLWGQQRLVSPLIGELNASFVNYQRATNVDGVRLDIEPAAEVPLPLGRFAFGAVRGAFRETAYHLFERTITQNGEVLPEDQSRETVQLRADVNTILNRVYPTSWFGLEKVRHTIEPQLSYLYIPSIAQGDLPLWDGVDRINRRNLFTYGVTSRLIGKFSDGAQAAQAGPTDSPIRELARVSLMQSVDISRDIQTLQATQSAGGHFSDVDIDGRVNPSRALSMRFHLNYDSGNNSFPATSIGFAVQDPREPRSKTDGPVLDTRTSAGVSYRFLAGSALQEVDSNFVVRLTDWAGLLYTTRYDVAANSFLDNFVGLRLLSSCDCWALEFAVVQKTNPHEVEVRAQLTLAGFGSSRSATRTAAAP